MADARRAVARDVLEEKPRATAGDVLDEKPRAAAGNVLEENPRAVTAAETVHDVGGDVADLEKDVPEQKVTTSSSAAQAGDEEEEEAASVLKRKLANTGFKSPYDSDYDDDEEYEDGNKESFIEKEAQKIREKGKTAYFKWGNFRCPYCTTKPKPKDGLYEHLMSHARGLSTNANDIKVGAEHAALLKALGPI
ncbi:hypothetical protein D1007_46271 [Hordeum vulgare]|nr:hypothetical protein D1007_46271 [Hordeum vulgare]